MTRVATVPALARLKARFTPDNAPRVLLHRGTCGDVVNAAALADQIRSIVGERLVESTCDGACWAAPAATVQRDGHSHRFARQDIAAGPPDELTRCVTGDCEDEYAGRGQYALLERVGRNDGSLADVLARGAYAGLAHAAGLPPDRIIEAVEASGGFRRPVAQRWRLAATDVRPRHLAVHAEGDEHGALKDRHLIEGDPHRLIEGILICCHATGISQARIDIDGLAGYAHEAIERALDQASEHGILDGSTLGNRSVTIEMRVLRDGDVDPDEPLIEGVEALCAITTAFDNPPPPTKLISLSGATPRPGLYEIPIDGSTTWSGILAMAGVMPEGVPAVRLSGPSARLVLPEEYETPLAVHTFVTDGAEILPRDADLNEL